MSVSVAELFVESVSIYLLDAVNDAVLTRFPVADELVWAFAVYVTEPPAGRITLLSLILPVPFAWQVAPLPGKQDQVILVTGPGNTSVTLAPLTTTALLFVTTIVYVTVLPGV